MSKGREYAKIIKLTCDNIARLHCCVMQTTCFCHHFNELSYSPANLIYRMG